MNCVATLASDSFVHPGSIVNYKPSQVPASDRLDLPVADITGSSCLVPGAEALTEAIKAPAGVSIPQLSYETNGSLKVGADIELPQLYGTTIKAGPQWSDVEKVDLAVEDAWVTQLDENLAAQAIRSCSIRKECVDRIQSQQYRVVATSLVAKGLSYKFYDKSGSLLSLDAAAKAEAFTATLGASSDVQSTTDATLKAVEPRVVGVRLLPADIFANQQVCEQTVLFSADGSASVSIGGGGGHGHIGSMQTVRRALNETAELSATGTESSECDDGFERKTSGAKATARVESTTEGNLRLSYDIEAHGGHYVTAAGCAFGEVVGKTGHDTSATASADLAGTVFVIVRAEKSPPLRVTWNDMPPGATIQALDWHNEPLRDAKGSAVVGPIAPSGDGGQDYETRGPGLYRVEIRVQLNASVGGNDDSTSHQTADLTVGIFETK